VLCCGGSREIDGEHLGGPLRRKMGMEGGAKGGVIRMGGIPNRIGTGKEMGRDGRRDGKLKGSEGNRVRDSMRRQGKVIVGCWSRGEWEQEDDGSNME
jgi:hypothetical protein